MRDLLTERIARRALIAIALAGLVFGALAWANGNSDLANWCWAAGTVPVVIVLLFSILRDFLAGRFGVDSIAFVSMAAALVLASFVKDGRTTQDDSIYWDNFTSPDKNIVTNRDLIDGHIFNS
jgi:hypothetical protein